MSKIVFVLGAGASKHCGTPLTDNFLEVAQDLLRLGEVEEVREDFENVFDAVGNLHAIQSKARINTYNVEDVYAAFEMGKLLGSLPGIENSKIERLTSSIRKVIAYTLERTTKLRYDKTNPAVSPESYSYFAGIIHKLLEQKRDCSIITFNYDLGLDYSLAMAAHILPDYALGDRNLTGMSVTYLKLHGSINWGRCSNCRKIVPHRRFDSTEHTLGADYSIIPVISALKKEKCTDCEKLLDEDPFIVPPTWNKTAFHEQIEQVWRRAAAELKDAENIFVLGYSFPETDMFFRYLFALGVDMRTILKGFYVYNTDPEVKGRFENLLGSGINQRFHFYEASFEEAMVYNTALRISGPSYRTMSEILDIS